MGVCGQPTACFRMHATSRCCAPNRGPQHPSVSPPVTAAAVQPTECRCACARMCVRWRAAAARGAHAEARHAPAGQGGAGCCTITPMCTRERQFWMIFSAAAPYIHPWLPVPSTSVTQGVVSRRQRARARAACPQRAAHSAPAASSSPAAAASSRCCCCSTCSTAARRALSCAMQASFFPSTACSLVCTASSSRACWALSSRTCEGQPPQAPPLGSRLQAPADPHPLPVAQHARTARPPGPAPPPPPPPTCMPCR